MKNPLPCMVDAAHAAGKIMRDNWRSPKKVSSETQHDIKLELDVRCQKKITSILHKAFPDIPLLGEEGNSGDIDAEYRWVVDPIDGTVNFTYGIPHACVSVALQRRGKTQVGVVFDPFCDELWTAVRGKPALLNGRKIVVSQRTKFSEAIVSVGFAKHKFTMERMLPTIFALVHQVRKIRIMGSATLALTYVASGRLDMYTEYGVRLWDIAAGGLILECAGGEFWNRPVDGVHAYHVIANNGRLRRPLQKLEASLQPLAPQ